MVHIHKKCVSIYEYHIDGDAEGGFLKFITQYNPLKIYIGKSYQLNISNRSYTYDPKFDGNSILLQISKSRYVFIGESIYEFSVTNDIIIEYYSIVNDGVSSPVAIGKKIYIS